MPAIVTRGVILRSTFKPKSVAKGTRLSMPQKDSRGKFVCRDDLRLLEPFFPVRLPFQPKSNYGESRLRCQDLLLLGR